jgi:K(+)-stimulated pyrophosphate-energized sodium pump
MKNALKEREVKVETKIHGKKMICVLAITAIAMLFITISPAMAQEATESEPRDLVWIALVGSIIALLFCVYLAFSILRKDEGTDEMKRIAAAVREGANAYLKRQYIVVGIFFVIAFIILSILVWRGYLAKPVPLAFLTGGFFSGLSGFIGMKIATQSSSRTANAASQSLNSGLRVAFSSGAIMGLVVVGLGLLDLSVWYYILKYIYRDYELTEKIRIITAAMLTFEMGASSMALFARVGGGIFTKAADVGADLVGKVEAGIPEDDPRNPAVIADNVGDNVGDVAGMGADLYESYVGSIVATMALGAAAFGKVGLSLQSITVPLLMAAVGVIASIIGTFFVRAGERAEQGVLLRALRTGIYTSAVLIAIASFFVVRSVLGNEYTGIWGSVMTGLIVGLIIGYATEYFTSDKYKPTRGIAEQSQTGPATVIISGLSVGMMSTIVPVVTICLGIFFSFYFSKGFSNPIMGLYGVGIAAVGMLSTLGITLATDAYGPVADNAGGNAEMADLPPEVRERTDALDALGNTTAATGKGFAIGSAALTSLALISAYKEEVLKFICDRPSFKEFLLNSEAARLVDANFDKMDALQKFDNVFVKLSEDFPNVKAAFLEKYFNISLDNPKLLIGLLLGGLMPFIFGAFTMQAVGRAAGKIVMEVRRQFREIKGIMEGTGEPDYASCVSISTAAAQKEMILPSLLALIVPIVTGIVLGVEAVVGLLIGGLTCGFILAVMMANAGGAWDNAKKYIEKGALGGKGSDAHKAAVVGDTVGDPFKDTSGPSLNILIKLMSMVSLVFAAFIVANTLFK